MMTMRPGDHVRAGGIVDARHTDDVPLRSPVAARGARLPRPRRAPRPPAPSRPARTGRPARSPRWPSAARAAGRRGRGAADEAEHGLHSAQYPWPHEGMFDLRPREHPPRAPGGPAGARRATRSTSWRPQPVGGVHRGRGQTHGGGDRGTRLRASANETRIGHGFHGFSLERFHDDRVLADASARRADGSGASRSGAIPHPGREPNVSRWETTREDLFQSPDFSRLRGHTKFFGWAQFFFLFSFLERRRARAFDDDETDIEPNT